MVLIENMREYVCKKIDIIPQNYFKQNNPTYRNGYRLDYSQAVIYPERTFCAYLFYLFMSDKKSNTMPAFEDLTINGEIYKLISGAYIHDIIYHDTVDKIGMKYGCYPDLVIHAGQSNTKNNLLALEVKTVSDLREDEFNKDYFKVNAYIETLSYQHSFIFYYCKQ